VQPSSATGKAGLAQKVGAIGTFFIGLFLAASILSFHPADPPSDALYPPNDSMHNWCGSVGSYAACTLLSGLGDGAYPLLLFVIAGAFMWLSQLSLEDKVFRIIGAGLLVLDVSVASAMIAVDARLPEGNGGILGLSIWMYMEPRLGAFGTVLMLIPVGLVGLVLLTDTWLIIVPVAVYKFLRDRAREPAKRLATAALATVGAAGERLQAAAAGAGAAVAEPQAPEAPRPIVRRQHRPAEAKRDEDAADRHDKTESARQADEPKATRTRLEPGPAARQQDDERQDGKGEESPAPPRAIVIRHNRPAPDDEEEDDFAFTPLPSTPRNKDYQLPPVDLLGDPEYAATNDNDAHINEQAGVLTQTLGEFGIEASVVAVETGPVITQYEIALAPGIKVGKVIGLADDMAIALKAPSVRIVAPLPGKDTIGIEVPNLMRQTVRLKEIVLAARDAPQRMGLPLFLGKDATGDPLVRDLAGMPHLLIAGTTGSGKSVCLNTIIMSLLLTRTPDDLRLVLIDPKMVELSVFKRLPHLMCPVVNDMHKAEAILGWLVEKMDERYRILSEANVKNITAYNRLTREEIVARFKPETPEAEARLLYHMPHICVIVDELADLMMVAAKEVETHVTRLSQKSRAVGIHLVMATQRPSVDVLTGLIKSNLPIRIAFQTASRIDSRTILDSMGAEKLLGQGDMLLMVPGANKLIRAQGAYVSDTDIQKFLDFIADKAEPDFQRELVQLKAEGDETTGENGESFLASGADDPLYDQSVEIILENERGSVSLLQRRLGIGYGRAARLIDQMAEDGIVGDYKGSQAREILVTLEQWKAAKERRRPDERPKDKHLTDEEADLDT
jgi:S-DNA-T family DNA segregation ATPase FtsK/SpoIIIE